MGGWILKPVKGTRGCSQWKCIGVGSNRLCVLWCRWWHSSTFLEWQLMLESSFEGVVPELFVCSSDSDPSIQSLIVGQINGKVQNWDVRFHRHFNDWEFELLRSFVNPLYTYTSMREGCDRLSWTLNGSGKFDIHSFYTVLHGTSAVSFPWRSIWCVKAPRRVFCMDNILG